MTRPGNQLSRNSTLDDGESLVTDSVGTTTKSGSKKKASKKAAKASSESTDLQDKKSTNSSTKVKDKNSNEPVKIIEDTKPIQSSCCAVM